jgi:cardiolipin synthase
MNQYALFTKVQDFYTDLAEKLSAAQHRISMAYFAFDSGVWAERISQILIAKARAGVQVRLMADGFGQVLDKPSHTFKNVMMFNHLRENGVKVQLHRPTFPLRMNNRLHCKFAALDDRMVYLGGSNIGDYYTLWTDSNLRVGGNLGNTFHDLFDFLSGFSIDAEMTPHIFDVTKLSADHDRLWLTVPHHRYDVRDALMKLILNAEKSIFIRTWYFLPDAEMLDALCAQAQNGVQVNVLLSHETRVRPVDFANYLHIHKLVCAGGNVHRYAGRYMHSKAAWNDSGTVLFGSANLDPHSMYGNFESCLEIHDSKLTWDLRRAFYADLVISPRQTPESHSGRSFANKAITHACNLASPWL